MLPLRAIEPDWLIILHRNRKSLVRLSSCGRDKSREETILQWRTWCNEGSLNNIVVLWVEMEGNDIADLCGCSIGCEDESCIVIRDLDVEVRC